MSKKKFIDSIRVENPCSEGWDEMTGNDKVRFCSHCAKHVNNLSEMTRKDAFRLMRSSNGRLCIRYYQDPVSKRPLFAEGLLQIARRAPALSAGALTTAVALSTPAYAQTDPVPVVVSQSDASPKIDGGSGKISGTVTDPNGAIIPYILVSLTNDATSEYRTATTSAEGFYEFNDLPDGPYAVKIEAGGFETNTIKNIWIEQESVVRRDTQMAVAKVNAELEVKAVPIEGDSGFMGLVTVDGGSMVITTTHVNPLMQAIHTEDLDEVKNIVARKPKVNFKDRSNDGMTPLHAAVETGNIEIVQFLLDAGAKVNTKDSLKRTPIMMLDEDATPDLLDLLLRYGATTDGRDKQNNTLLHLMVQNSVSAELVSRLSGTGINFNSINKDGQTALMLAADEDDQNMIEALLNGGANATLVDKQGKSAIDRTVNEAVAQMLVAHGAFPRDR